MKGGAERGKKGRGKGVLREVEEGRTGRRESQ